MKRFNELYESILNEKWSKFSMTYKTALEVRDEFSKYKDKLDKTLAKTQYIYNEMLDIETWAKKIGVKREEFEKFLDANQIIQNKEYEVMDYVKDTSIHSDGTSFIMQDPEDN